MVIGNRRNGTAERETWMIDEVDLEMPVWELLDAEAVGC